MEPWADKLVSISNKSCVNATPTDWLQMAGTEMRWLAWTSLSGILPVGTGGKGKIAGHLNFLFFILVLSDGTYGGKSQLSIVYPIFLKNEQL